MSVKPIKHIYNNGDQEWSVDGVFHREDGPAYINTNGRQEWYINGKLHRTDGPAILRPNGTQEWWINGKRHREDGPAFVGYKQLWFLNNKNITIEVENWMELQNIIWPFDEEQLIQFRLTFVCK